MAWTPDATDRLAVNTIRTLAIDMVEKANSGHPGLPLGAAPMAYVLWQRHLVVNPADPKWPDRDRFVLSPGHGSALLYALLHLGGFDLPLEELKAFRQWGSKTPGHPEFGHPVGTEATTGPLGQGSAVTVGMAIAERMLAARLNAPGLPEIVNHRTFALVSDGDLMEGISAEAGSLAGHLGLGKLVYLYDANDVSLDGPTSVAFTEDVGRRYEAYGWHVQRVADGDTDLAAIDAAIESALAVTDRPSLVVVRTTIGYGSPGKAGKADAHGAPLGEKETAATKQALGWPHAEPFAVPDAVRERMAEIGRRGLAAQQDWMRRLGALQAADPERAEAARGMLADRLPEGWDAAVPSWKPGDALATRDASGLVLNAIAERLPALVGGDADLSGSTKTRIKGSDDFQAATPAGRNIRFGVREHAMGAITNGIAYHRGLRPFAGTFLAFADYMRNPIRLAALDRLRTIYVFTHDSLAVGEDGPTHQPVEQVASLRAIPGLAVLRPADANETAAAWRWAIGRAEGPVALVLTRQKLPVLPGTQRMADEGVMRGGYVLAETDGGAPQAILLASGSEVQLALAAREQLAAAGIRARVVSMPGMENFAAQDEAWRRAVLPPEVPVRVAIEAGIAMPWHRFVGERGRVLGVDRFGHSAPGELVLERYGFTTAAVVEAVQALLG
jgi:transketolase